jgi:cardiolipin synthase
MLSPAWRTRAAWAGGSSAATIVLVLLWTNLTSSTPPVAPTLRHDYATGDSQFVRVMGSLLGPPMVQGNRLTTLLNGDQIFPAMLSAIHSARRSIDFETCIYWSGEVGREFAEERWARLVQSQL